MAEKPWYQSKIIIVNALSLAASVLIVISGSDLIASNPKVASAIAASLAVVNIALRFITVDIIK